MAPGFDFGYYTSYGVGASIVSPSVQVIWNWGTFEFDAYWYHTPIPDPTDGIQWEDIPGAGIGSPGPSISMNAGAFFAFGLPSITPEDYTGYFNEITVSRIYPSGIGGYCNYATTSSDNTPPWSSEDGPWTIGAGLSLGTPGFSTSYNRTIYDLLYNSTEEEGNKLQKYK